jgi:hypothetical protein
VSVNVIGIAPANYFIFTPNVLSKLIELLCHLISTDSIPHDINVFSFGLLFMTPEHLTRAYLAIYNVFYA